MQINTKGLSRRERRLILIGLAVVVFALITIYVYIPLYNNLIDKMSEYQELELDKQWIEASVASEDDILESYKAALKEYATESAKYISRSLSNEIGRLLTELCERHDLAPVSQQLFSPKEFVIDDDDDPEESVFVTVTALMTVRGSYSSLKTLFSTVERADYLRIARVSYDRTSDDPDEELDKILIYFEVTMLKDLDSDEID